MPVYIPHRGDFISLSFDPQSGHEQKGRRPALVISHTAFNKGTGLAIVCPVTNTDRGIPFHVSVGASKKITGYIMVEQVKSVDFNARKAKRITFATKEVFEEVLAILDACVY